MAKNPTVRVSYQHCEIFSSQPMSCPLCHAAIPAKTMHRCGTDPEVASLAGAIVDAFTGTSTQPAGDAGRKRTKR